ncbi:MAG: hypothetical protein J6D03_00605 [Clostridia bacterium]|nr:hypothetical protein [Clostridia bacterium]
MRTLPTVPLTKENFEEELKISTGLNFIDVKWIEAHKPEDDKEKYVFLAKLIRNIQLNLDRWVDGELNKYGRFRIFEEYPDKTPVDFSTLTKVEQNALKPSVLVEMLQEIIFDGFDAIYLLGDTGAFIMTSDGQKIII